MAINRQSISLNIEKSYVVALSGGADSVALLLLLKEQGYNIHAAHCNFHLRQEESDRDEQFCVDLCQRLAIPLHRAHFDTYSYAESRHVSIETAARQLRYGYFASLVADIGAEAVCVAHHRDDNVETVLMKLFRGTGLRGLAGIRPRQVFAHLTPPLTVVRPLLSFTKREILDYLNERHQDYVTDSTNLDADAAQRNHIRLELLPAIREVYPTADSAIASAAAHLHEAEKIVEDAMQRAQHDCLLGDEHHIIAYSVQRILALPSPDYFLFWLLSPYGFTSAQVTDVRRHLQGDSGTMFISATHQMVIDRGRLLLAPCHEPQPPLIAPIEGNYVCRQGIFRVSIMSGAVVSKQAHVATLDYQKVVFPITLRQFATGDKFTPYGMKGEKLVSDYLTDRKKSILDKQRQLVVADATGQIVWVVGERTSQRHAVDKNTTATVRLELDISSEN